MVKCSKRNMRNVVLLELLEASPILSSQGGCRSKFAQWQGSNQVQLNTRAAE